MNAKIWLVMVAVTLLAVSDWDIYSDATINKGDEYNDINIYSDAVVTMMGGSVDSVLTHDISKLIVNDGYIRKVNAWDNSIVEINGGIFYSIYPSWDSVVSFSGDSETTNVAVEGRGTFNVNGGTVSSIIVMNLGKANLSGGNIAECLEATDSSEVNIYGYDLSMSTTGGSCGNGQVWGFWADGTEFAFDLSGGDTCSRINLIQLVEAVVDVVPDTVNLRSKGKWISCNIGLPDGYDVGDVNSYSILLEEEIEPEWIWFNEGQNVVMAKFARSEIAEILEPGEVELTVSGYFEDGSYFEGKDIIKIIDTPHRKD